MLKLDESKVKYIVLHTTDSYYGDVPTVDKWHRDRGWLGIGYHYLITNCFPTYREWDLKKPDPKMDGVTHIGRPITQIGAHVHGKNSISVGVAMVGRKGAFTSNQLWAAVSICKDLFDYFRNVESIVGHYELFPGKTCPDLDMDLFRRWVEEAEVQGDIGNVSDDST